MQYNVPLINVNIAQPKITIFNFSQKGNSSTKLADILKSLTTKSSDRKKQKSSNFQCNNPKTSNNPNHNSLKLFSINPKDSSNQNDNLNANSSKVVEKEEQQKQSKLGKYKNLKKKKKSITSIKLTNHECIDTTYKIPNYYLCSYCEYFTCRISRRIINKNLHNSQEKYILENNRNEIDYILFNHKCTLVAKFKDFLIWDDLKEFIDSFIKLNYSRSRIIKYVNSSRHKNEFIIPLFAKLSDNLFYQKNIGRKRKVINIKLDDNNGLEESKLTTFLKSKFVNSLLNDDLKKEAEPSDLNSSGNEVLEMLDKIDIQGSKELEKEFILKKQEVIAKKTKNFNLKKNSTKKGDIKNNSKMNQQKKQRLNKPIISRLNSLENSISSTMNRVHSQVNLLDGIGNNQLKTAKSRAGHFNQYFTKESKPDNKVINSNKVKINPISSFRNSKYLDVSEFTKKIIANLDKNNSKVMQNIYKQKSEKRIFSLLNLRKIPSYIEISNLINDHLNTKGSKNEPKKMTKNLFSTKISCFKQKNDSVNSLIKSFKSKQNIVVKETSKTKEMKELKKMIQIEPSKNYSKKNLAPKHYILIKKK